MNNVHAAQDRPLLSEVMFIADDFGLDPSTNEAVIRAHREGALHGASLMMGQPGTEEAVRLARENTGLQVGWHLHLCDSTPVTRESWPWGCSPLRAGLGIFFSSSGRGLMQREIKAQWDLFQKTGLECAFVNAHHHLHVHPSIHGTLIQVLPAVFRGWIRMGRPRFFEEKRLFSHSGVVMEWAGQSRRRKCRHRLSDTLWGMDRTFKMNACEVARAVRVLGAGLHEFIFHPRRASSDPDFLALMELKAMGF